MPDLNDEQREEWRSTLEKYGATQVRTMLQTAQIAQAYIPAANEWLAEKDHEAERRNVSSQAEMATTASRAAEAAERAAKGSRGTSPSRCRTGPDSETSTNHCEDCDGHRGHRAYCQHYRISPPFRAMTLAVCAAGRSLTPYRRRAQIAPTHREPTRLPWCLS